MATIGYASALGSIAKDAISGAGKGFVGGLKGAMMTEAPGLTGAYAFGKELKNRANAPRVSNNGTSSSNSPSSSGMGGGLGAGISIVAGQQKQSNVINLEQVRQLRQLNNNVINQSKLIAFQVNESKRKDLFAEELANEQALRDDKLLEAIQNIGGNGRGGRGGGGGELDAEGGGSSFVSGLFFKRILTTVISAVVKHPYIAGAVVLGGAAATAAAAMSNRPRQASTSSSRTGRDAENDPAGAASRAKADLATRRTIPRPADYVPPKGEGRPLIVAAGKAEAEKKQKAWDAQNASTHDPVTGMPKNTMIMRPPATGTVSSKFGVRKDPNTGKENTQHNGVDISMPMGTPVFSVANGKVIAQTTKGNAGTFVSIEHPDGKVSEYMHLQRASVKVGDIVGESTQIGVSGGAEGDPGAGNSKVPHLHLQIRESASANAKFIDPASLPGLTHLVVNARVKPTDSTPALKGPVVQPGEKREAAARQRRNDAQREQALGTDYNAVTNYDGKFLIPAATISEGGAGPVVSKGLGGGGGDNNRYSFSGMGAGKGIRPGGGSGLRFKQEAILTEDETVRKAIERVIKALGANPKSGTPLPTKKADAGIAKQTEVFKPLFKYNSDIIADANKTFLQQFRSTATNIISQGLTKALFPKGVGVSAGQAGRDDMYRGQQLQKIFGTDKIISSATTKLLGKQYGPMFAPMFNNLAQGYLEVGSRVAGKAIFQGIGGLGAQETQTITGQVLGNFAAGNKKLALEQLLYGASGGKESGIALGAETLFAKYGFANPMEGISYFASALGEKATQPFAKLMGADDRDKSIIFDPRTKQHVYADTGAPATQADINASGSGYGSRISQTPMFSPGMNNYGTASDPYGTTAGTGGNVPGGITNDMLRGGSVFRQISNARPGQEISRAQAFGLTEEAQARGGAKLQAEQNTLLRAQAEIQNKQLEQQAKLAEENAKQQLDIAMKQASTQAEADAAQAAYDRSLNEAKTSTDRVDTDRVIAKLDQVGGKGSSGTELKTGPGSGRRPGQLFDANQYDSQGKRIGTDPMKEIGNFGFDMLKNAAGNQLTKNIKNPYAQMVANFAIQKGLNYGVDALMKSDFVSNLFSSPLGSIEEPLVSAGGSFLDTAISWFTGLGGADGGYLSGPGTGRSDSIPAMLSNGEFVVNAESTKKYRPLLDALNYTKYADGTPSTPGLGNALSKALGTADQLNALGDQTDLLTSIDGSLRVISGTGTSSGTGLSFDTGLAGIYGSGGTRMSGGGNTVNGVARSRATQQKPSAMDYATAIGTSLLKSYAIRTGVNAASTAIFGSTPASMAGTALYDAGFTTLGTMVGGPGVAGANLVTGEAVSGAYAASTAGAAVTQSAAVTEAVLVADTLGGAAAAGAGGFGASVAAAIPYVFVAVAAIYVLDQVYGGGDDEPPPKEPKYHAGIYVAGNNNINAIAPILVTTDYHAPPEVYKTVAYGLLRVAFNATKSSEAVTKMTASYDFIYMKVQYDKISMIVGKGAPNSSYTQDGATDTLSWPAPAEGTNLNAVGQDIINWVRDDFKKLAKAENLGKLDKAAEGLGSYTLDELSSGLIPDLKRGQFALDKSIEKGIYANSVAESNRIAQLITTASSNKAYTTTATPDEYISGGMDDPGTFKAGTAGGIPMVYSLKEGKFIESKFPGAILIDTAGRPVYDIEGTSAGLTVDDFVSASVAGSTRLANVMDTTSSSGGATSNIVVGPTKTTVDNSAVTNYYTPTNGIIDLIRAPTPQIGFGG